MGAGQLPGGRMKMPALTEVGSARGAPKGRPIEHSDDALYPGKFNVAALPMEACGAYDRGGAYWGWGSPEHGYMYRAYCLEYDEINERDFLVDWYFRANGREHAKQLVTQRYPNARFYR